MNYPNLAIADRRNNDAAMITGPQIRMARAALGWSASNLAEAADLSLNTIQRLESADGVPSGRTLNLAKVQFALETAGLGTASLGSSLIVRAL